RESRTLEVGRPPSIDGRSELHRGLGLAKAEPLKLASRGSRKLFDKLDDPRVLVRRDLGFDEVLESANSLFVPVRTVVEDDISFHNRAAVLIGHTHDCGLGDVWMAEQRVFDLGPGDVVA